MGGDRRRQRQQRVRHEAGDSSSASGVANKTEQTKKEYQTQPPPKSSTDVKKTDTNVTVAEPQKYESVTVMQSRANHQEDPAPQKYRRREILSNWSRYEELPEQNDEDGQDYHLGEDFEKVLQLNARMTGGFLRLKGEKGWGNVDSGILKSHGLGALKVADLVSALGTIPLHVQLNIPEERLPAKVISYYNQLADDNRRLYKPSQESKADLGINDKILHSLQINEEQPLNLASEIQEETHCVDERNALDLTMKFSSAFAPEPDDVDLDRLIKEQTPEECMPENTYSVVEPSSIKNQVQSVPARESQKSFAGLTLHKEKSPTPPDFHATDSYPPKTIKGKEDFDFGLPKRGSMENHSKNISVTKADSKINNSTKQAIPVVEPLELETDEHEAAAVGPAVDLDAPVKVEKDPVILVDKTETENLEDWLDSVLED